MRSTILIIAGILIGVFAAELYITKKRIKAIRSLSETGEVILYTIKPDITVELDKAGNYIYSERDNNIIRHLIYKDGDDKFTKEEIDNLSTLGKYYIVRVTN